MGRRKALLAAGGMFALGFGAMNAFWFLGKHPENLLGHWDYRAPIIGDGILLPVAAGILTAALGALPTAAHERRVALTATLLGGAVGAGSQWIWLRDPSPLANWTLPEPHHFTLPGWYHAAFLVAASGWFAGAGMLVLWRVRSLRRTGGPMAAEEVLRSPWGAILFACLFGFAALAVLDSTPSLKTAASQASVAALFIAVAISLGMMRWVLGPLPAHVWKSIASGILFAIGLAWLTVDWRDPLALGVGDGLVVGLITLALVTEFVSWASPNWALNAGAASVWLMAGLNSAANSSAVEWSDIGWLLLPVVIAYVALAVLLLWIAETPLGAPAARIFVIVLPVPLVLATVAGWLERYPDRSLETNRLELAFTVFVITWLVKPGQRRFWIAIHGDKELERGFVMESGFIAAWVTITTILAATAAGFLRAINAPVLPSVLESPRRLVSPYLTPVIWAGVVALVIALLAGALARPRAQGVDSYLIRPRDEGVDPTFLPSRLAIPSVPWMLALLATVTWISMPGLAWLRTGRPSWSDMIVGLNAFGWIMIVLSAFIAAWLFATSLLNLWGTAAQIEFYRLGKKELFLVWLTSASFGTNAFWLLVIGFWSNHGMVRLIDIVSLTGLVVLGGIVVAVCTGVVIMRSTPLTGVSPRYLSLHYPGTTLGQDHLMHGFLLLFAVASLYVAYRLSEVGLGSWAVAIFAIFPIVAVYGEQTLVTKEAYAQHIHDERFIDIERSRQSLLARVQYDPHAAAWLNDQRCNAIQWRANWINNLALSLALPLLALQSMSQLWRWIQGWAFGVNSHASMVLPDPSITAVINENQELHVPDQILIRLGVEPGDKVAFVITRDAIQLQPASMNDPVAAAGSATDRADHLVQDV